VNDARGWIFGDRSRSVTGHSWAGGRWPLRVVMQSPRLWKVITEITVRSAAGSGTGGS